jgi:hypothetical protein
LKDIQTKFEHDFAGVATNGADGFAFFVNQPIWIGKPKDKGFQEGRRR